MINPPHGLQVKTNIAKSFFSALDKNFPKEHRYYKIFNRHTVKLAFSTTPNLENIIASINSKKLRTTGEIIKNSGRLVTSKVNCNSVVQNDFSKNSDRDDIDKMERSDSIIERVRVGSHSNTVQNSNKRNRSTKAERIKDDELVDNTKKCVIQR